MTTRSFLEFVWKDQEGLFEVAASVTERRFLPFDQAVAAQGMRFFAPLARIRKRGRDEDVVSTGNVVWVDIDRRDALEQVREILDPLGFHPSAIVDSGNKGYWLFFKLARHIATERIVQLNKALITLVDGDRACSNAARIARLPGSVHPVSGNTVTVIEMTATLFDPDELFAAIPPAIAPAKAVVEVPLERELAVFGPVPAFNAAEQAYIRNRPVAGIGIDRSNLEQRLFTKMIYSGWTDEAIIAFADQYQLPKHTEERTRSHSDRWIKRSLQNAHCYIEAHATNPLYEPMCIESQACCPQLNPRLILEHVQGQTVKELHAHFTETDGVPKSTFDDILGRLEDAGYITRTREGRFKRVTLTAKAKRSVHGRFRRAIILCTVEAMRGGEHAVHLY